MATYKNYTKNKASNKKKVKLFTYNVSQVVTSNDDDNFFIFFYNINKTTLNLSIYQRKIYQNQLGNNWRRY